MSILVKQDMYVNGIQLSLGLKGLNTKAYIQACIYKIGQIFAYIRKYHYIMVNFQ